MESPKPKLRHTREHHEDLGVSLVPQPGEEGCTDTERQGETLRLGVLCLLLHDLQNHLAGSGAALRGGVDADGFLCGSRVFFPVHVNPGSTGRELGRRKQLCSFPAAQVPAAAFPMELTLHCKVICTPGRQEELILGSRLGADAAVRSSNHTNPNKASASIYFKQQER